MVDSIANYLGYEEQYLAEQIRKDHWQNAWNDMRRPGRLYGLFTEMNKIRRKEQRGLAVCNPQKSETIEIVLDDLFCIE